MNNKPASTWECVIGRALEMAKARQLSSNVTKSSESKIWPAVTVQEWTKWEIRGVLSRITYKLGFWGTKTQEWTNANHRVDTWLRDEILADSPLERIMSAIKREFNECRRNIRNFPPLSVESIEEVLSKHSNKNVDSQVWIFNNQILSYTTPLNKLRHDFCQVCIEKRGPIKNTPEDSRVDINGFLKDLKDDITRKTFLPLGSESTAVIKGTLLNHLKGDISVWLRDEVLLIKHKSFKPPLEIKIENCPTIWDIMVRWIKSVSRSSEDHGRVTPTSIELVLN